MESTRRTFLKQSAAVSAACFAALEGQPPAEAFPFAGQGVDANDGTAGWYGRPMRWMQLAFVEAVREEPSNKAVIRPEASPQVEQKPREESGPEQIDPDGKRKFVKNYGSG